MARLYMQELRIVRNMSIYGSIRFKMSEHGSILLNILNIAQYVAI